MSENDEKINYYKIVFDLKSKLKDIKSISDISELDLSISELKAYIFSINCLKQEYQHRLNHFLEFYKTERYSKLADILNRWITGICPFRKQINITELLYFKDFYFYIKEINNNEKLNKIYCGIHNFYRYAGYYSLASDKRLIFPLEDEYFLEGLSFYIFKLTDNYSLSVSDLERDYYLFDIENEFLLFYLKCACYEVINVLIDFINRVKISNIKSLLETVPCCLEEQICMDKLTDKELEVYKKSKLILNEKNKLLAQKNNMDESTLNSHMRSICFKFTGQYKGKAVLKKFIDNKFKSTNQIS